MRRSVSACRFDSSDKYRVFTEIQFGTVIIQSDHDSTRLLPQNTDASALRQDDLGGSETNTCTDNEKAMCDVWTMAGRSKIAPKQVYYQEYAQTAACGCVGCGAGTPAPNAPCQTWPQRNPAHQLDGCHPRAVDATPYVQEMRRSCSWGYAYPFDDNRGGLVCEGAKSLTMTVADASGGPRSDDGGDDVSSGWEILMYAALALLVFGVLGCNFWHGFMAWPPCLLLLSAYAACLVLAWLVWKGKI